MSTFVVLLLCVQACLIQNVFSQCLGAFGPSTIAAIGPSAYGSGAGIGPSAYAPAAFGNAALAPGVFASAAPFGYQGAYAGASAGYTAGLAPYGGAGEGNVAVAGELPVAGNAAVTGQVPIMGAVRFSGPVPAAGAVSISGNCACGCSGGYVY